MRNRRAAGVFVTFLVGAAPGIALAQESTLEPPPPAPAASPSTPPSAAPPGVWVPYGAPPPPGYYVTERPVEEDDQKREDDRPGPGMRNAGIGLTLGGAAVGLIGAGVAASADNDIGAALAGIGFGILGGAMFLTGVPLWAVGAARYDRANASSASIPASLTVAVGPGSASLRGAF